MTKWWSVLPIIFIGCYLQITQPDPVKALGHLYYDTLHSTVEEVSVDDIVLVNIDEKAIATVKEINRRYKLTSEEWKDIAKALKEVGNQIGDLDDAVKGKARKGRKAKK